MAWFGGVMMLKDGKFIRELPPIIGGNYFKTENREYTEEELEWQETFLAVEEKKEEPFDLSEIVMGTFLILVFVALLFILILGAFDA
jgi:hypothetical protein